MTTKLTIDEEVYHSRAVRKALYDLIEAVNYDLVATVIVDDDGRRLPIEFARWGAAELQLRREEDQARYG